MGFLQECFFDCPYCGEPVSVLVDTSCDEQSYIEDCQVCCRPMVLNIHVDDSGVPELQAYREDE